MENTINRPTPKEDTMTETTIGCLTYTEANAAYQAEFDEDGIRVGPETTRNTDGSYRGLVSQRIVETCKSSGYRFAVLTEDGEAHNTMANGKAAQWIFSQRGAAESAARRSTGLLYDAAANRVFNLNETTKEDTTGRIIRNNNNDGETIRINHPEDLLDHPEVGGVFATSGRGYCVNCATSLELHMISTYITNRGDLFCENCEEDAACCCDSDNGHHFPSCPANTDIIPQSRAIVPVETNHAGAANAAFEIIANWAADNKVMAMMVIEASSFYAEDLNPTPSAITLAEILFGEAVTAGLRRQAAEANAPNPYTGDSMDATEVANDYLHMAIEEGRVRCDCGGPQYGTDHAPDCAITLAWDRCYDEATEDLYCKLNNI